MSEVSHALNRLEGGECFKSNQQEAKDLYDYLLFLLLSYIKLKMNLF